jgi:hypothetical protein
MLLKSPAVRVAGAVAYCDGIRAFAMEKDYIDPDKDPPVPC